jgi:hypothetical protein
VRHPHLRSQARFITVSLTYKDSLATVLYTDPKKPLRFQPFVKTPDGPMRLSGVFHFPEVPTCNFQLHQRPHKSPQTNPTLSTAPAPKQR